MLDVNAPIVPWKEMGGIGLYSNIRELIPLITNDSISTKVLGKFLIKYEIGSKVDLWFNVINGKLFKITALSSYKGSLFEDIVIGMHIKEVLNIEPSFIYDEFEEVYCSNKGIYIETNPIDDTVLWISVFIKEIDYENFELGVW